MNKTYQLKCDNDIFRNICSLIQKHEEEYVGQGEDEFCFFIETQDNLKGKDYRVLQESISDYGWYLTKKTKGDKATYFLLKKTESLEKIQKQIDFCNCYKGCDKYCSLDAQKTCRLLKKHNERIRYGRTFFPTEIEYW